MIWRWANSSFLSKSDLRVALNECGLRIAALMQENDRLRDDSKPLINEAYIQDTEARLRREIELMRKREDQLWKEFQYLRAENERLTRDLPYQLTELKAENEALRAKMRRIAELNAENLTDIDALIAKRRP